MTHETHGAEQGHTHAGGEPGSGWTGYAAVKYGFIFLIVLAILYFIAAYVIPALT